MDFSSLELLELVLNVTEEPFIEDFKVLKYLKLVLIVVKDFKRLKELIDVLKDFMVLKLLKQGPTQLEVIILKSNFQQNCLID